MAGERTDAIWCDIDGCFNVRDAGGYDLVDGGRMRTGRLYRADDPVRLTPMGREAIEALRLAAVVDLRTPAQVARRPGFADAAITHLVPLVDQVIDVEDPPPMAEPADLASLYQDMEVRGREQLVAAVDAVAGAIGDGPVLVHCAVGKDRTGMLVALIQAAIGVPLESIVEEYARSDAPVRARRAAMLADPLHDDPPVARSPEYLWTAPAESMALFAGRAAEIHGSLEAWPLGIGVTAATVDRLRAGLVEPA